MVDITMCAVSEKCPVKTKCYRHTATKEPYRQSWGIYSYDKKSKSCEGFIENVKNKTKKVRK